MKTKTPVQPKKLIDRAERLADDLGRGHYSMATAISMIRELAEALRKSEKAKES